MILELNSRAGDASPYGFVNHKRSSSSVPVTVNNSEMAKYMQDGSHLHAYNIQSDGAYFYVGRMANGNQGLIGVQFPDIVVLEFDPQGTLLRILLRPIPHQILSVVDGIYRSDDAVLSALIEQIQDEIGFHPGPIVVNKFFIADRWIGIRDLPRLYEDVLKHPEHFESEFLKELHEDIRVWREREAFVLYWADEYYFNKDGQLESS